MTQPISLPSYNRSEELANSITHGIGIVLAIAGLAVLTAFSSLVGTMWHIIACSIYGTTQILLYTASTLYHSIPFPPAKKVLRVLDHSAIYLLIAGTYTPFMLVSMGGPWGWGLFILIWSLAIIGIALQGVLIHHKGFVTALPYIGMGWVAVVAAKPLLASLAPGGIRLLVAGGLVYTVGCLFYAWRRLPYHHAIWHLFVLMGSLLHFFAVLFYVIPLAK